MSTSFAENEQERQERVNKILAEGRGIDLGHGAIFTNKMFTDLEFIMPDKSKVLAHEAIVSKRCSNMLTLTDAVKRTRKKKQLTMVEMKDNFISADILNLVLLWVYTGSVDLSSMNPEKILKLCQAARSYKLTRLQWLAEHYLQESLTLNNVFPLLKQSHALKDTRIKGFCLKFAVNNYNTFIANKDGVRNLGIDLFQEVVSTSADPASARMLSPRPPPPNTITDDFKSIYNEMTNHDGYCRWPQSGIIKFHKAVLASKSEAFLHVFQSNPKEDMSDWTTKEHPGGNVKATGIDISNISSEAFSYLLRHLYYGESNIPPNPACQLIPFSRKYNLPSLLDLCENIIQNNVSQSTVLSVLSICYLRELADRKLIMGDLRKRAISFAVQHLADIDLQPLRSMDPKIAVDILFACQAHTRGEELPAPTPISKDDPAPPVSSAAIEQKKAPAPTPTKELSKAELRKKEKESKREAKKKAAEEKKKKKGAKTPRRG